jgi:hypothetical protein
MVKLNRPIRIFDVSSPCPPEKQIKQATTTAIFMLQYFTASSALIII